VVGIAVLQMFGIQTASLVAVLGATSLAIGLALQGTLSNLAAGVMLLLFRPFHVGDDVEVAGRAGKVKSLSLFMTELVASDNTFPVRAGAAARAVGDEILKDLCDDPRVDRQTKPAVHVSKVMDVSDPTAPIVELTVSARVKPSETDAVRQTLLDRAAMLVGRGPGEGLAAQGSG
jgi:small conductance mechanosensitive channel